MEQSISITELRDAGFVNAEYWANQESAFYEAMNAEADRRAKIEALKADADPEIAAFGEDLEALEDSTADTRRFAMMAGQEMDILKTESEEVILAAEEALEVPDKEVEMLLKNEIEKPIEKPLHSTLDEKYQALDPVSKTSIQHAATEAASKAAIEAKVMTDAAREVAAHPTRFMISQIREAFDAIKEAKTTCANAELSYDNEMNLAIDAANQVTGTMYSPTKSVTMDMVKNAAIEAGSILNTAYDGFTSLVEKAATLIKDAVRFLCKTTNVVLEQLTLGAYSRTWQTREKNAEMAKNGTDKDDLIFDRIQHRIDLAYVRLNPSHKGIRDDAYWKEIKEICWEGGVSPADKIVKKYEQLDKAIEKGIEDGVDKIEEFISTKSNVAAYEIDAFVTKMKETPTAVKESVTNFFERAKTKVEACALRVKADAYGLGALVSEKQTALISKMERRAAAKVQKLESVDKTIFESMQKIKKEMHSLKEITPYVKEEYTPDPVIVKQIDALKSLNQTPIIRYQIKSYERQLAKSKEAWERVQEKKAEIVESKIKDREFLLSDMQAEYDELETDLKNNGTKLKDARNVLKDVIQAREGAEDRTNDRTAKSIDMMRTATEMTREDDREYDD